MTLKPEPSEASPLVYEHSPSFINIPISVKLKDIENQTNTLLKGLIYEDNTIAVSYTHLTLPTNREV